MEEKLIEFMDKALEGVDAGVDFVNAQLPDYIEQLLMWYAVKSGIVFAIGIAGLVGLAVLWVKRSGVQAVPGEPGDTLQRYRWTMTHDDDGDPHPLGLIFSVFWSMIFLIIVLANLDWLKIWIAPKVWLVEYVSRMVN